MPSRDLEKQDQRYDTPPRERRNSAAGNVFCDCDQDPRGRQQHPVNGSPRASPSAQSHESAFLQPTRSYLTSLSNGGVPNTNPGNDASGEQQKHIVDWDGDDDPMNPRNMHAARKWLITVAIALCSMCVTCTSSLYTMTYDQMNEEFGSSRIVATLGLSLFVIGLGLSPMALGPLSEFYGRRPIYIGAFVFFTIWLVPCAVAPNIETMLIARFFDGLSGSAFLSVAGGTVGDIFAGDELQGPMLIYTASPFIGPSLGPLLGGFINHFLDWRWSFYILLIWSGLLLAAVIFLIPETYHPVVRLEMIMVGLAYSQLVAPAEQGSKTAHRNWRENL